MLKIVLIIGIILVIAVVAMLLMMKGPDLSKYHELKQPRISALPNAKVLEISFEESEEGLGDAFSAIFKIYYRLKGVPKGPSMSPPAARYENIIDMDLEPEAKKEAYKNMIWKGRIAIPVPASLETLPDTKNQEKFNPRLTTWQYGATAEILHIGPYEEETPTVNKLKEFVHAQGYEITGLHEEVYLRGPGMPFSKPENYHTIIRYAVKKIED